MISVIIPSYNRRGLVLRAVQSVLNQTHADLECIVVDDASTDGTAEALRAVADERLRIIALKKNGGACAARNAGVDAAKGDVIAFQDSDDVWHADKLEKQLDALKKSGADVVVCGMRRIDENGAAEDFPRRRAGFVSQSELLMESLASTQCILGRAEALRAVRFDPDMPRLQDWDLMLCLAGKYRVYLDAAPLVDVYIQQDSISRQPKKLLTALTLLYRKHQAAINADRALSIRWVSALMDAAAQCGVSPWTAELLMLLPDWAVHPGERFAGRIVIDAAPGLPMAAEENGLTLAFPPEEGKRYLPETLMEEVLRRHPDRVRFADGVHRCSAAGQRGAIESGLKCLEPRRAWALLSGVYGAKAVSAELAAASLGDLRRWARALRDVRLDVPRRPVQRVAAFYHNLGEGGVQRVAAELTKTWVQMGLQATMICERERTDGDYELPPEVEYRVIPALDAADADSARRHTQALADALQGCDALVYHAWASPLVLVDVLAARAAGVRVAVHTHSAFIMPLVEPMLHDRFAALPDVYVHADALVALSDTDAAYWGYTHGRVYRTSNPMPFGRDTPCSNLTGAAVLWAGRMKEEKRPADAIDIMARVVKRVPHARLLMAGTGDELVMADLQRRIDAQGLHGRVQLLGHQRDMSALYRAADALLCTSAYEGYGLVLAEAGMHALPVVSYAMPYLPTLCEGATTVPQGDAEGAAEALIRLLSDGEARRLAGAQSRQHAETLLIDQQAMWHSIFDGMTAETQLPADTVHARVMETLRSHLSGPAGTAASSAVQTAFVPLPKRGPCKLLRKKAATFLQVLLIEGWPGVRRIFRD